ncbi:aminotransferase class I/II-fold pyridoxal phosphate-dependent enzyme [Streptomonospora litoralis]|uniref:8-amino-7-oxononanoate synthase n=1 Tax=Streptomonospora litoralis TaxID=2498135 RepID=A0A4P6PY48_9ACTN|nr:aminotransferase class I/II-fold pyridoxal phosphate-dependent enzyme [Streptomonospora litoralis]QBI53206.1 8-amino-7-oxononanoate synthase 1 [Streptomonospora litoralis]
MATRSPAPFDRLADAARERASAGLTRRLRPRSADPGAGTVDLAGNDYLAFARHPDVTAAAAAAARRWGAGATGSRLVTGDTMLHRELEDELADFCGTEAALVFSSGYTANLGMVTSLSGPSAALVCDRNNHASLIDAARLAKAAGTRVLLFDHADTAAAEAALADAGREHRMLLTDTVFSVDGDLTDTAALARACAEDGAALLLDDAHGLGVVGEGGAGALTAAGLRGAPGAAAAVTLSKSLGAQGGAVLGPGALVRHLVETARSFVFDTGLAPPAAGGALAALRLLRAEPERPGRLRSVALRLSAGLNAAGLDATRPDAAVVSVAAPSRGEAVAWAERCRAAGVAVGCFRPPSVPDGRSRIRLTAHADLTDVQVERAVEVIAATGPTGGAR